MPLILISKTFSFGNSSVDDGVSIAIDGVNIEDGVVVDVGVVASANISSNEGDAVDDDAPMLDEVVNKVVAFVLAISIEFSSSSSSSLLLVLLLLLG